MRSCIVIPPSIFLDNEKVFPQLGPYYIKRYVEENSNHIVDIMSYPINIQKLRTYETVGFSITTPQYGEAVRILKSLDPNRVLTVAGGPHCLNYEAEGFTLTINGDGCRPFLDILDHKIPHEADDDNDQLPYRDGTLHEYKYLLNGMPSTVIITSRGCPNHCYFCEHSGFPVRLKSSKAVEQEIQECKDWGFEAIMFFDDLFCLNFRRVEELCEVIKPFNIRFRCFAQASNFTEDMAKVLSESGCVEIGYGAEHADQATLNIINKKTTVEQNYNIIKIAHKYGIRVKAFLMIGLPGENKDTISKVREFIEISGIDDYDVAVYFPYKGTYIREHPEEFDIQISCYPSLGYYKGKSGVAEVRVSTSSLTSEEIEQYQRELWKIKH